MKLPKDFSSTFTLNRKFTKTRPHLWLMNKFRCVCPLMSSNSLTGPKNAGQLALYVFLEASPSDTLQLKAIAGKTVYVFSLHEADI